MKAAQQLTDCENGSVPNSENLSMNNKLEKHEHSRHD